MTRARRLRVVQNPHLRRKGRCETAKPGWTTGLGGWPRCPRATQGRQLGTRRVPRRDKTRPARVARPHFRYKTRPAHPFSPHVRYKTRPAHPKRHNLAGFARAWRTLYRCHRQQAMQGELCTECEAASGLAITAHQTPPVRRAWLQRPRAMAGPGYGARGRKRHNRLPNFARNLSRSFFEMPQKRCNSNDANSKFE